MASGRATSVSQDMPCRKMLTTRLRSGPAIACTKKKLSSSSRSGWVRWSLISSMRIEAANSSVLRASSTSWPTTPRCSSTSTIGANRKKRVSSMLTCSTGSVMAVFSSRSLWVTPATVISR